MHHDICLIALDRICLRGVISHQLIQLQSDPDDPPAVLVLVVYLADGLLDQVVEGDVVLPAPVVLRVLVAQRARPRLRDRLSEVGRVLYLEVGDALFNRGGDLLWAEADTSQVVHSASQLLSVCVEEVNGGLDAVVDVDHGQEGLGLQEALVLAMLQGLEEDLGRVHSSAVERVLLTGYHAGVPDAPEVHSKLLIVVCAELLVEDLGHAVHGGRLQDRVGGRLVLLEVVASKDGDGRGEEDLRVVFSCDVHGSDSTIHIHIKGLIWVELATG
ncbi:hypothetical protein FGO68_gene99 [Halteria grandinella]|uniref:Uncharacterized protein n=1 Tax=Halteria grandinella TaxID=5974 RepID=A0A8J8T3K5_HALGN|nr:hypothetical protein FGO68_gene99 [Halteria grandinella]